MKTAANLAFVLALSSLPIIAGCSAATDDATQPEVGTESSEIVSATQPVYGPTSSTALPNNLPDTSGSFALVGKLGTEAAATGYYSNGVNTIGPINLVPETWRQTIIGSSNAAWLVAPNTPSKVQDALGVASSDVAKYAPTTAGDAFGPLVSALQALNFPISSSRAPLPASTFKGYPALRSRSLRSQYVRAPFTLNGRFMDYKEPTETAEMRQRGARLYCAMRKAAQAQQGTMKMGELPAFSINIFNAAKIDFLVVQPTVALGTSIPNMATSADGTQAFDIPMVFGNSITPISGIGIPGLNETRFPVSLTTVDSEVLTKSGYQAIKLGALSQYGYAKEHQTVMHADAITTQGASYHASTNIPLFYVGPVKISTGLGIDITTGSTSVLNDKLLTTPPSGFSLLSRTGIRHGNYHDGSWKQGWTSSGVVGISNYQALPDGTTNPFWTAFPGLIGAMNTRVLQNDDHHLDAQTVLTLSAPIKATLETPDFGPLHVGLSASGLISGTVVQHHEIRDAVYGEAYNPKTAKQMLAAGGLVVRPRTTATAGFQPLNVTLTLALYLPWGDIDWTIPLLQSGTIPLANYDSDSNNAWSEQSYLRVGTSSETFLQTPEGISQPWNYNTTQKPYVHSHLPGGADYESFNTQNVNQCLATSPIITPPAACKAGPAKGTPPKRELCIYDTFYKGGIVPLPAPANICLNKALWVGVQTDPLYSCRFNYLNFLCSSVSHEQQNYPTTGKTTVSHVTSTPQMLAQFGELTKQCAISAHNAGYTDVQIESLFTEMFRVAACEANGSIIPGDQIITAGQNPSIAPTPTAPGTCAP